MKLILPSFCHFCHFSWRGVFLDELNALQHPAVAALVGLDSEDLSDGLVEALGADRFETVEGAPVFVGGVQDGAVEVGVVEACVRLVFVRALCHLKCPHSEYCCTVGRR